MTQPTQTSEQVVLMLKELQDEVIEKSQELGAEDIFASTIEMIGDRIELYVGQKTNERIDGLPDYLQPGFDLPASVEKSVRGVYLLSDSICCSNDYEDNPTLVGYSFDSQKAIEAIHHLKALPESLGCGYLEINADDPDSTPDYEGKARGGSINVNKYGECQYQFHNEWSGSEFFINTKDSTPAILHEGRAWAVFPNHIITFELNGKSVDNALIDLFVDDIEYQDGLPDEVAEIVKQLGLPHPGRQEKPRM